MLDRREASATGDPRDRRGAGEIGNDTFLSLAAGKRVEIPPPDTIADGLRSPSPGELTFPIIQRHVERVVLVTEAEIREAMKFLLARMKILVEPSGAVSAAAALFGQAAARAWDEWAWCFRAETSTSIFLQVKQ